MLREAVALQLRVKLTDADTEPGVPVEVWVGKDGVQLMVGVPEMRGDAVENEGLGVVVKVLVGMRDSELECDLLADAVRVAVSVTDHVRLALVEIEMLRESDCDTLGLRDREQVVVAEVELLGECRLWLRLQVRLGVGVYVVLYVSEHERVMAAEGAEGVCVGVPEDEYVVLSVPDRLDVGVCERVDVGEWVPVVVSDWLVLSVSVRLAVAARDRLPPVADCDEVRVMEPVRLKVAVGTHVAVRECDKVSVLPDGVNDTLGTVAVLTDWLAALAEVLRVSVVEMLGEMDRVAEMDGDTLGVMEDADKETCVQEMVKLRRLGVRVGGSEPVGERLVLGESVTDQLLLTEGDPGDGEKEGLGVRLEDRVKDNVSVGLSWRVLLLDWVALWVQDSVGEGVREPVGDGVRVGESEREPVSETDPQLRLRVWLSEEV
mmetsp:Transcript_91596/g.158820  ORF Transcript_91596/g.158820 Transcript_91596/m.158820 type:complete len:432 (-) Transcript_91596:2199-3494(-)